MCPLFHEVFLKGPDFRVSYSESKLLPILKVLPIEPEGPDVLVVDKIEFSAIKSVLELKTLTHSKTLLKCLVYTFLFPMSHDSSYGYAHLSSVALSTSV